LRQELFMTNGPKAATPASISPPPRYYGMKGALTYGFKILSFFTLLALIGGGIAFGLTGDFPVLKFFAARLCLLGLVAGGAAAIGRWICRGQSTTVITRKLVAGDLAGLGGVLVGILLPGAVAERQYAVAERQHQSAAAAEGGLVVGQPVAIAGPTLDGGRFDLADHHGKVVLVDFWASWCRPCVEELPHIARTYEKYHDRGLDMVGVSLDFDQAALTRFLKANPTPWPQVFFPEQDGGGSGNLVARRYAVDAIPFLIVIDRDGNLAARDVRGPEIEPAVAAALGLSAPDSAVVGKLAARMIHWLIDSLMRSPAWLCLLCGWGGAAAFGLVEAGLRRAFGRAASASTPNP
jgi:thiol-disulfide isomerase/thioredoxin